MTRQVALDFAKDDIRVLAICPGSVDMPLVRSAIPPGTDLAEA